MSTLNPRITAVRTLDLRFPTSRFHIGSDAVNKDPDYSAAYCILETDTGLEGHGLTFTLGRGTELCVMAVNYLSRFLVGRTLSDITANMAAWVQELTGDTQFRWLGPEKGVIHLAAAALVNAVWDLWARAEGKPVWRLLADLSPEQIVACIDFRYITDALTPEEALEILRRNEPTKRDRIAQLLQSGLPAYTTSVGWFGFSDDKIRNLCQQALSEGWTHFKLKVGGDAADDLRRGHIVREEIGWDHKLMVDANQKWDVGQAIDRTRQLAELDLWWMEEPTSPDDILGHRRIRQETNVRIATGEHCQSKVMFKQLLQAEAIDVCQIDSCRVAGVNENLAIILMAAKFGIPVCPHAGGVGLCEYVQHLSAFDFIWAGASLQDRVVEYVDHLHEHFLTPVQIQRGRYMLPQTAGFSIEIYPESLREYEFPSGTYWLSPEAQQTATPK
ncbi:enolase superfamily enzyme related to L-alanine-DL-glutamate epimerase [Terriglobus roseus DSM 18391]|uniref:L-fuconate dehydratase n=1 Tax=Terriglobus roseus (strain DSM 18391 / NRRL B-41598 / KBS 63) TaxID=926566 RepID=I3ZIT4_TERRK|nr:enolase C-terminal domain-like protein [Terriglobus roseus]AFL89152.1 enolase superfamily enzyme related to L-alanine-DL-glutamate epimerase [Terriglobus roseus DSM 18391]